MLYACVKRWKWFVLSLLVCLSVAIMKIKTTPPTYQSSTRILLLNSDKSGSNYSEMNLEALGLQVPNSNLKDEMEMLHSPVLMEKVVEELGIQTEYTYPGMFFDKVLYGFEVPIDVQFADSNANGKQFKVKTYEDGHIEVFDFNVHGKEDVQVEGHLNEALETPCGVITVLPTESYNPESKFKRVVQVRKSSVGSAAGRFLDRLDVSKGGDKKDNSSVVKISLTDQNLSRAKAILSSLLVAYDENWRNTQNRITENTSNFLAERINAVGNELGAVDDRIADFKGEMLMPDAGAAQSMYMGQNNATETNIQDLQNQVAMLRYVRAYILDNLEVNKLLPTQTGVNDAAISSQIENYNTLVLQRNELVLHGGNEHPQVRDLESQLVVYRKNIIASIDQSIMAIFQQIAGLEELSEKTAGRIVAATQQEKTILSTEREQKVKEALYIFLLQEKERTDMTLNRSVSNVRVTKKPGGSAAPIAPLKTQIIMVAIAMGLGLPFVLIFLLEITDTKVRSRKDLESVKTPIIGEIPLAASSRVGTLKRMCMKLRKQKQREPVKIYVEHGARDVMNEGFRLVRTNLEFMLQKDTSHKVILFTSANPGSGKSFLSANMAKCMALLGKKILVMDFDMRRATVSTLVPGHHVQGAADYLGGYCDEVEAIIAHEPYCKGVDVIPVGTIPPNPTELLHGDRLAALMTRVREQYDYVFLDCPPIDIVADADVVNRFADMSIFVVRAGLMDRAWLSEINKIYTEQRFNNLCVLLNGTNSDNAYSRQHYGGYYGYYGHKYYSNYYTTDKQTKK